jgi:hypothetical protein
MSSSPAFIKGTHAMYPVKGRSDALMGVCDVITFAKPPPMKFISDPFGCVAMLTVLGRPFASCPWAARAKRQRTHPITKIESVFLLITVMSSCYVIYHLNIHP